MKAANKNLQSKKSTATASPFHHNVVYNIDWSITHASPSGWLTREIHR